MIKLILQHLFDSSTSKTSRLCWCVRNAD